MWLSLKENGVSLTDLDKIFSIPILQAVGSQPFFAKSE